MLQVKQKWDQPKRNLAVGDIVISKESESTRNKWPLGKVVQVYPSDDGYVRKVRLLMADRNLDDGGKNQCPPSYLDSVPGRCLSRDQGSPHRGDNREQLKDVAKVLLSVNIVVNT